MSDKEKMSERKVDETKDEGSMEAIRKFFVDKLHLGSSEDCDAGASGKVLEDLSFTGLTEHWKQKGFKNVITMVGAGISTSAGIPDFRSPGSGLYDNLQKYDLPHPSAIFEMGYFAENPQPFFALAKELYPGNFTPTPSHYFVRLLHEKGILLRHYTQNIDTLERIAGIPAEKLVEAHGTFYTNHCLDCGKGYSMEWMKEEIFADRVPTCESCNGVVKPDIVFFGENLPERFYTLPASDFADCDLLIIMGTSLEVHPFASLVDRAGRHCVRLLINRTKVGNDGGTFSWFKSGPGLLFDSEKNTRDVAYLGDCDDGVMALADELGWGTDLRNLVKEEHARLAKEISKAEAARKSPKKSEKEKQKKKVAKERASIKPEDKDDAKL